VGLVQRFSHELADQHGYAVDFAIHAPRPHNDPRSYHAHLLTSTREVLPTGLGAKTALELNGTERSARGLGSWLSEILAVRERWATLTNEAFMEANVDARIDHRSLAAQGIDREPLPRIPVGAWRAEAQGRGSDIADRIREAYRGRVQERMERAVEPAPAATETSDLEAIRREARQRWLRLRQPESPSNPHRSARSPQDRARKDVPKEYDADRAGRDDDQAI
jgi:hypothetical protein